MKLDRRSFIGIAALAPVAATISGIVISKDPIVNRPDIIAVGDLLKNIRLHEDYSLRTKLRVATGDIWEVFEKTEAFSPHRRTYSLVNRSAQQRAERYETTMIRFVS